MILVPTDGALVVLFDAPGIQKLSRWWLEVAVFLPVGPSCLRFSARVLRDTDSTKWTC